MSRTIYQLCLLLMALGAANSDRARRLQEAKRSHEHLKLTDADIDYFSSLSNYSHVDTVLDAILIPRVVGTPNHSKVGDYLVKHMIDLGWDVEQDIFTDKTPVFGKLNFRNIIARLNPDADRYLVLACHYDSKHTREHVFLGATDSAVPCAMMLNLALVMQKSLSEVKSRTDLSLAFVFFDGEEAFRQWGPTDSIYGARHLARKWQNTAYPVGDRETNHLDRIDILVLLDLLGAPDPTFFNYFSNTERWYLRLATAEQRLADRGLFTNYSRGKAEQKYFRLRSSAAFIEDDHIPFLRRNVNILHLIPNPFPDVWHREDDNRSALDLSTIDNLNKILRIFVAEYLHLHSDKPTV